MNDRNAAIKALERAWNYLDVQMRTFKAVVLKCNGVYDGVTVFDETLDGIKDAIELLKAQEPVAPIFDYDGRDVWRCGNCHRNIFHPTRTDEDENEKNYRRFCFHCGRVVKWK